MSAAAILAIIKAIPAVFKMYEQTVDLYFKSQEAADINQMAKNKAVRDALIAGMLRPGVTDNELKDIRRHLYAIGRN